MFRPFICTGVCSPHVAHGCSSRITGAVMCTDGLTGKLPPSPPPPLLLSGPQQTIYSVGPKDWPFTLEWGGGGGVGSDQSPRHRQETGERLDQQSVLLPSPSPVSELRGPSAAVQSQPEVFLCHLHGQRVHSSACVCVWPVYLPPVNPTADCTLSLVSCLKDCIYIFWSDDSRWCNAMIKILQWFQFNCFKKKKKLQSCYCCDWLNITRSLNTTIVPPVWLCWYLCYNCFCLFVFRFGADVGGFVFFQKGF